MSEYERNLLKFRLKMFLSITITTLLSLIILIDYASIIINIIIAVVILLDYRYQRKNISSWVVMVKEKTNSNEEGINKYTASYERMYLRTQMVLGLIILIIGVLRIFL